jgi:hypothetical protein
MPNNSNIEKRWACVKEGKVQQVIIWDGVQDWPPSKDYQMIELPEGSPAGLDWDYIDGEFVDNRPQPDEQGEAQ